MAAAEATQPPPLPAVTEENPAHSQRLLTKAPLDWGGKTEIKQERNIPGRLWQLRYGWSERLDARDNQPECDHTARADADLKTRGGTRFEPLNVTAVIIIRLGNVRLGRPAGGRPAP